MSIEKIVIPIVSLVPASVIANGQLVQYLIQDKAEVSESEIYKQDTDTIIDSEINMIEEVQKKVFEIISKQLGIQETDINLSMNFVKDLGVDSLDVVEIILGFEKEFNISIPDEEIEKIETVEQAVNMVYDLLSLPANNLYTRTLEDFIPLKIEYDLVTVFHKGVAEVKKDDKWGLIDITGNEIIPCVYESIHPFLFTYNFIIPDNTIVVEEDNFILVQTNDLYGFIDMSGAEITPCIYESIIRFADLASVKKNEKWGIIDQTGKEIVPCIYDLIYGFIFSEDLVTVKKDNLWGFVDKSGNEVIHCKYDHPSLFTEGLAAVIKNGKTGFINKVGEEVVPFIFDEAHSFSGGITAVKYQGKWGLLKNPLR